MNDRGDIKEFEKREDAEKAGYTRHLSPGEYQALHNVPAEQRVRELELMRFMRAGGRNSLPDSVRQKVENAFNMGWKARHENAL